MSFSIMAMSVTVVCSPVAMSASSSRGSGSCEAWWARRMRPSVTPDMADNTTTTSWPAW